MALTHESTITQIVKSVFGRSNAVAANTGDYTADEVTNAADLSSSSQQAFTGEVRAPDFAPSGLTGATASSRNVGARTSGAPTTGTFQKGDWLVTQDGHLMICTVAGTPGTWVDAGWVLSVAGKTGTVTLATGDLTDVSGHTGSGSSIVFANAPTLTGTVSIQTLSLTNDLTVANGGTGAGTFTNHGVLLGSGTSPLSVTAAGSSGQYLQARGSSLDPIWATIAASDISGVSGTTGSGNMVLANSPSLSSPSLSNPTLTGTATVASLTASGDITAGQRVLNAIPGPQTISSNSTVSIDFDDGPWQTIVDINTSGSNITVSNPTHPPSSSQTAMLTIEVVANSGASLKGPTVTFSSSYRNTGIWTDPISTNVGVSKASSITFGWNGSHWVALAAASNYTP